MALFHDFSSEFPLLWHPFDESSCSNLSVYDFIQYRSLSEKTCLQQAGPRRGIESVVGEILLREGSRRTSRVEEEETLQGQKEGDEVGRMEDIDFWV